MPRPISSQSVEQQLLARISRASRSTRLALLGAVDFEALGTRRAVDVALHRLANQGVIRRLDRGLYYVPRHHPSLGEIRPTPEDVAQAFAARHHLRLQPSGAHAANLLGMSEQVPLRLVYLTDGLPRRIQVGRQEILFKRTTPKNMATAGRVSGTVIQALRHLGKASVTDSMITMLRRRLTSADRDQLRKDAPLAPAWIAEVMRTVAGPEK